MTRLAKLFVFVSCGVFVASSQALDDLQRRASWQIPTTEQVHAQFESWLGETTLDDVARQQQLQRWTLLSDDLTVAELLEHLVRAIGELEPDAGHLVTVCFDGDGLESLGSLVLNRPDLPNWMKLHLRLVYGRWLADRRMYNEARLQLQDLMPADVVDPATLLFYQIVVAHHLIEKDTCLEKISLLLEHESRIPRRYAELARLMKGDIQPLEQESLDEISRIMRNIHNRLDLGRAGKRVRTEEEEVLEKLEKMIEQLEQQAQSSGGAGSGSLAPGNPASDSAPLGGTGPGDVNPKAIDKKFDWGNLPPKERQEALQQISKDFPAHYRNVIEEYFKKIARDAVDR